MQPRRIYHALTVAAVLDVGSRCLHIAGAGQWRLQMLELTGIPDLVVSAVTPEVPVAQRLSERRDS